LRDHDNGENNTAIGYAALWDHASGASNVALGGFAGSGNTTGSFNISIGSLGVDGENNTRDLAPPENKPAPLLPESAVSQPAPMMRLPCLLTAMVK
jgi:hypothetical protein